MNSIVEKIRQFVENECKKPTAHYGYEPYPFHLVPMVAYADKLAKELNADREVVTLAAWLHDIGSIINGRENHHITGSEIAEKKLRDLNYPADKITAIKNCILHHRGSTHLERTTLEEKIIAEADVLSNFDNLPGIFKAAFVYENLTQGEAKIAARTKLENKYHQLHFAESKKLIKPKYEAVMLLLAD